MGSNLSALTLLVVSFWTAFAPAADSADSPSPFRFVKQADEGTLTLFEADRPVLVYNFTDRLKPGLPEDRKRSCYIHPVYGLDGETLTEDFPPEGHFHHRGLCWAWAEVTLGDRLTDPWDLRGIRARFRSWGEPRADANSAILAAEDDWVLDETRIVASETMRLEVHKATDVGRAIDVEWHLAAQDAPLQVAGRKTAGYGGFMFRFPALKQTSITTSEGPQPTDANLKPCEWADLSSCFAQGDTRSGAAIFLHPMHPGRPVGWTLRYYGLLNPAWPGVTPFTLKPGEPLVLRYRLWIHRGDAAAGAVQQAFDAYRQAVTK